jgi:hypothetical protein
MYGIYFRNIMSGKKRKSKLNIQNYVLVVAKWKLYRKMLQRVLAGLNWVPL